MARRSILLSHLLRNLCFDFILALNCWILFSCRKNISAQVKDTHPSIKMKTFAIKVDRDTFVRKDGLVEEIKIDRSPKKNESVLSALIQPFMPNVPLQLWEENKEKKWFSQILQGRCAYKKARCSNLSCICVFLCS